MDNLSITYDIDKKLNGYRASHRNKWRFIQHGLLSIQEVALLEFYADIMDFDPEHIGFGTVKVDFPAIAVIFNNKSENTGRNWHKKLLKLGFIEKTRYKDIFKLKCHKRYINPGHKQGEASDYAKAEKDKPINTLLQNFGIESQKIEQTTQIIENKDEEKTETTDKTNSIALISSKDESNLGSKRVVIRQDVRSDEEYQRIYQEGDFTGLTPDDMKWIDENVSEVRVIEDSESEKDIVEVFFDGDWEKYEQNLIQKNHETI